MKPPLFLPTHSFLVEKHAEDFYMVFGIVRHLHVEKNRFQTIEVVETSEYGRVLLLDGIVNVIERGEWIYHEVMAHLPLFAHADARRVLIVGGGDGGVAREVLKHPQIEHVTVAEIDERVVAVAREHFPGIARSLDDPRIELRIADARAITRERGETYDVVIVDSTDPFGPAACLVERDFYEACAARMGADALLIQQLASPFHTPDLYRDFLATLAGVFPLWRPVLAPFPFYTTGEWGMALASKGKRFWRTALDPQALPSIQGLRYFNEEMYAACLAQPNHVRAIVAEARRKSRSAVARHPLGSRRAPAGRPAS